MKACVLGAGGLLGTHTCAALTRSGYEVTGLTRRTPRPAGLAVAVWATGISPLELLASAPPWALVVDCRAYCEADVDGLADHVHQLAARWIHLSSIYVYRRLREAWNVRKGERFLPVPISEDTPCRPSGRYGEGKLDCERLWQETHRRYGGGPIILRLPFVFGPGDRSGRIEYYARALAAGESIAVPRGGAARIDLVYAGDVARVIVGLTKHDGTGGWVFNIAPAPARRLRDIVAAIACAMGVSVRLVELPAGIDSELAPPFAYPADIVLDGSRLARTLGHVPSTPIEHALRRTLGGPRGNLGEAR